MNLPSEWVIVHLKDIVLDTQPGFAQRPSENEGSTAQIRTHNVSPDGQIDLLRFSKVGLHTSPVILAPVARRCKPI
jgi:hypothetical protein